MPSVKKPVFYETSEMRGEDLVTNSDLDSANNNNAMNARSNNGRFLPL